MRPGGEVKTSFCDLVLSFINALEGIGLLVYIIAFIVVWVPSFISLKGYPRLPSASTVSNNPLVSIIVPARNEVDGIKNCVDRLLGLDYEPKEVIVVDDRSIDGTYEVLKRYGDTISPIAAPPLPKDWIGKNWACHLGYQNSHGELLLFTDADTKHDSQLLIRAVSYLLSEKVDLLSLTPCLEVESFWEKALVPPIAAQVMRSSVY